MMKAAVAIGAAGLALGQAGPAAADEGMWTFDNFPVAAVKAEYGVTITPAWLDRVRRAAVRLSTGCSASEVSATGLILTANHCVSECAQYLSSSDHDFYLFGYAATTAGDEKKCAGMQAEILIDISDVTRTAAAATGGATGATRLKAEAATIGAIEEKSCAGSVNIRCQVVNLYHGGQYKLYRFRKYSDVRLVFSPGIQMASFGGDPDNFNFPRYDFDCAFLRIYENGVPAKTPDHLVWSKTPGKPNDLVFVVGNPDSTERQLTMAQLDFQRTVALPNQLMQLSELRGRLIRFGAESNERRRVAQRLLFWLENNYKARAGGFAALNNPALIDRRRADELTLRRTAASIREEPSSVAGDPWSVIEKSQRTSAALYQPYMLVSGGPIGSQLFDYARWLVRAAAERTKPSDQRLPEYADAQLPLLQKRLLDDKPVAPALEQLTLEFWLSKVREYLTVDGADTKLILGQNSPEELSATLARSCLGDLRLRQALWQGGTRAIAASSDPMIRFVERIDAEARRLQTDWNERVVGPTARATQAIADVRFAVSGSSIYPDATSTPRLTYGRIAGWSEGEKTVPPFTYFPGLYARATGRPPFELDQRWRDAKGNLSSSTTFNISTTNDISPGNSGSPLINAKGKVIGVLFDSNIHSLGGSYWYDPDLNRAISLSAAAIFEAVHTVYSFNRLSDELERARESTEVTEPASTCCGRLGNTGGRRTGR